MEYSETIEQHISLKTLRWLMKFSGMWYSRTIREKIVANAIVLYTLSCHIIGIVITTYDTYYFWGDYRVMTFNISILIFVTQELLKMLMMIIRLDKVRSLNLLTENIFWNVKYETEERLILQKCNIFCVLACSAYFAAMMAVDMNIIGFPELKNDAKNGSVRRLPYSLHLQFEQITPIYEILYVIETFIICGITLCATAVCSHLFTLNIYAAGQFQILQRRIMSCCEYSYTNHDNVYLENGYKTDRSYENLRECVKRHQLLLQYVIKIEEIHDLVVVIQAIFNTFLMCFIGILLILEDELSITRDILEAVRLSYVIITLYLTCHCCQILAIESTAVGEAAYSAFWYNLSFEENGKAYRKALMFIVMRAHKGSAIRLGKTIPITMTLFTTVFSKSLSFLTVLRKSLGNHFLDNTVQ